MLIKILLIILIAIILSRVVDRYIRKEFSLHEVIVWSLFWLIAAGLVIWPDASSWLAAVLGVGRGADLVVYLALMLIFYLLFRIFVRFEKQERELSKLVQKQALDEAETHSHNNMVKK